MYHRYGTAEEARDECKKKANKFRERGTPSTCRQERQLGKHWAKTVTDIRACQSWEEVLLNPALAPSIGRKMNWARLVFNTRDTIPPPINIRSDNYKYQARIDLFLAETEPDDQHIIVVVDPVGRGKSQYCKWACSQFKALYGKADNAHATYAMFNGQRVCLFDVKRVEATNIDWSLIENLKVWEQVDHRNILPKPIGSSHVLLFMPEYPDLTQLRMNRWHIIDDLSDDRTIHQLFPPSKFPDVINLSDPFDDDCRPSSHRKRLTDHLGSTEPTPILERCVHVIPEEEKPLMLDLCVARPEPRKRKTWPVNVLQIKVRVPCAFTATASIHICT